MLEIFSPVTVPLGITNLDFVIALSVLIYSGIFAFLGTEKAYSAFYGTVVGIGIYVVLQTLLSPTYQSVETAKFIGPATSKFFIATSAYLIPILFFLSPANGKLKIEGSGNMAVRILESMAVSVWALMLMVAVCKGLANKTYVFTTDSAFTLLSKSAWYGKLSVGSEIFAFLSAHLQTIVLVSVLFAIYKAFFAEIVSAAVMAWVKAIFKARKGGDAGGHDDHGGHEEDHGGHDGHEEDHGGHEEDHGGHWAHWGHGHH